MLLFVLFGLITVAEGSLSVTSSTSIISSIEDPLIITCNFTMDDEDEMKMFFSLTLFKKDDDSADFTELLVINSYNPVHVTEIDENFKGSTHGRIVSTGGNSYLEAEFFHPTEADAGVYLCESHGFDRVSHSIRDGDSVQVTALIGQGEDTKDLEERIEALEEELKGVQKDLQDCQTPPFTPWFGVSRNVTDEIAQEDDKLFGVTEIFNSESFYIIVDKKVSFDEDVTICEQFNGYLLEINTEEELLFLEKSLKDMIGSDPQPFDGLVTGAFYHNLTSPLSFYSHPEDDDVYDGGHWDTNEPDRNDESFNWLVLMVKSATGELLLADAKQESADYGAVCEVSMDKL